VWLQRTITFEPRPRGIHPVTREALSALPELGDFGVGILHLLIQHTSASLTLNENASPEVRATSSPGSTAPSPNAPPTGPTPWRATTTCPPTSRRP
jgi:hypothetical protein